MLLFFHFFHFSSLLRYLSLSFSLSLSLYGCLFTSGLFQLLSMAFNVIVLSVFSFSSLSRYLTNSNLSWHGCLFTSGLLPALSMTFNVIVLSPFFHFSSLNVTSLSPYLSLSLIVWLSLHLGLVSASFNGF